jgi:ABC-2 type transport system permease protein
MLDALRADLEMARRGYARYAAYPGAALAGIFTNTVFGFMRAFILLALFQQRDTVGGYDASAAVTYVWVGQALLMTVFMWGWLDIATRIRTGDIATDLVRPIHPLRAALAFDLGRAAYHIVFRGIPPFLVGMAFFPVRLPADALVWLAFLASVALAVVVSFYFRVLYNVWAFWTTDVRGTMMLGGIVANLFSGFLIPVSFFPDGLAAIARATPFPSIVQTPIDIFVGTVSGPAIAGAIATQIVWALVLAAVARWTFELGVRRLVVQGG